MCGIVGYWSSDSPSNMDGQKEILRKMSSRLKHRGPDSNGIFYDQSFNVGLAHRRLAIIDTSSSGHQPMESENSRFVISFNGEIYNHQLIRKELLNLNKNISWRGSSDTETLLKAIDHWGLQDTLKKIEGMFAFAIWDKKKKDLYLVRDRLGEKPLYYGFQKNSFLFGSELKAIIHHPSFIGKIDRDAVTSYLRFNYVSQPYSIYKGIKKLPPGTYLKLSKGKNYGPDMTLSDPIEYWSLSETVRSGIENPFEDAEDVAINRLDSLLKKSIEQQMVSDVPLGAFLSGGIDSSTIVAIMQSLSAERIKTFTIGFHESDYNEANHAKVVAEYLGTDHSELYVTEDDAMKVIPSLNEIYDEPFSDSSQIPTFLVSRLTNQDVTVSLSGDAGDEIFGGYNRYNAAVRLFNQFNKIPKSLRLKLASILKGLPIKAWEQLGRISNIRQPQEKIKKVISIMQSLDMEEAYLNLISHNNSPSNIVIGGNELDTFHHNLHSIADLKNIESKMMYMDMMTYLTDDILVKLDRAAMAVSLETRVPFLNTEVIDFAWRLPINMKIRNNKGKWILREVLKKYMPNKIIDRPKMGFGIPIDKWLRGSLLDWAENLLDDQKLKQQGYFQSALVRNMWKEHLSGKRNHQYELWDILMFQSWLEEKK